MYVCMYVCECVCVCIKAKCVSISKRCLVTVCGRCSMIIEVEPHYNMRNTSVYKKGFIFFLSALS